MAQVKAETPEAPPAAPAAPAAPVEATEAPTGCFFLWENPWKIPI